MTSYDKYTFLPITRDRIEIKTWDRHQCVRLDLAHRMICNTTWFGQFVTLTLGQGHYLTFQGGQIIQHSIHLDEANTMMPVFLL